MYIFKKEPFANLAHQLEQFLTPLTERKVWMVKFASCENEASNTVVFFFYWKIPTCCDSISVNMLDFIGGARPLNNLLLQMFALFSDV